MKHSATFTCIKICMVAVLFAVQIKAEQCTTPNNEKADCISLYSCPVLLSALLSKKNSSVDFVTKSNCGGTAIEPMVCCGPNSEFQKLETTTNGPNYDLLAGKTYCGLQHSDDYVRPTTATSINEFPWLARIKYKDPKNRHTQLKYKCIASLINPRYVLTAAHCLVNINGLIVDFVRLGEYHSKNETDCVDEDAFITECSEPVEDVEAEELIPHPAYTSRTVLNDIGLIRLKKNVQYSDYIRPICLPTPGTKLSKVGDILVTTGWGGMQHSDNGEVSIKKKIFSAVITNEECSTVYSVTPFRATESHLCTISLQNNTDLECRGDSGGPVMFTRGLQWFQEAIVSTGKSGLCAENDFPEIHTNVVQYIKWIVENMRP